MWPIVPIGRRSLRSTVVIDIGIVACSSWLLIDMSLIRRLLAVNLLSVILPVIRIVALLIVAVVIRHDSHYGQSIEC